VAEGTRRVRRPVHGGLGGIPREGCAYPVAIHGKRVRAILEAALRVVFE
jgi:hypothetical protein